MYILPSIYVFYARHDTPGGNNMPPDPHLVNENTFPETIDLFFNRPSKYLFATL